MRFFLLHTQLLDGIACKSTSICKEITLSIATPIDLVVIAYHIYLNKQSVSANNYRSWISTFIKRFSRWKQCCYNRARISYHPDNWQLYLKLKQKECWKAYNKYINGFLDSGNGQLTKGFGHLSKIKRSIQCATDTSYHITITWQSWKIKYFQ